MKDQVTQFVSEIEPQAISRFPCCQDERGSWRIAVNPKGESIVIGQINWQCQNDDAVPL
jgi:hypothetical protein